MTTETSTDGSRQETNTAESSTVVARTAVVDELSSSLSALATTQAKCTYVVLTVDSRAGNRSLGVQQISILQQILFMKHSRVLITRMRPNDTDTAVDALNNQNTAPIIFPFPYIYLYLLHSLHIYLDIAVPARSVARKHNTTFKEGCFSLNAA